MERVSIDLMMPLMPDLSTIRTLRRTNPNLEVVAMLIHTATNQRSRAAIDA
ncbi:MAG: hypothetical protein H7126_05455 [Candidatus Parcubacteria bacterium]|uniref:hypothetical protein n=1 Tax=Phormidesmis priestleyi TaxID=268141 RepID=UPI0012E7CDB3|nr:hypothetical protein [Phormidesmis priestleyi]MBC7823313.1 hypothetical protein [Leptolyngbyaceae cyanobacterium LF-bin-113]